MGIEMPRIKLSISNNYSDLDNFLKKHKVIVQGGAYIHTSICHPRGSYYICKEERDEFFKKYYQHVFVKKLPAHLTEGIRDCEITPIKIDLDFRAWQKVDENQQPKRLYEIEDIIKVCQRYMTSMEKWLVTPD